jgi:alpha-tubulin suppressor-like RCC1 family protein
VGREQRELEKERVGEEMKASTKVVSFGLNFNGQLGYECYDNKNPRMVNAPSDLVSLNAGWNCSVAVTGPFPFRIRKFPFNLIY